MKTVELHNGPRYRLVSHGNGLMFHLVKLNPEGGLDLGEIFLQGDDASQFEDDREATEIAHPDFDQDAVCAWLWDQCEYGSLSE